MSHTFKAKSGTVFNFNSDLSGLARITFDPHGKFPLDGAAAHIPAADLLEFVDWYRKTPGYGVEEEHETHDPNWTEAERVHDWRNYIDDGLKAVWATFTNEQRVALRANAQRIANAEEWD